MVAGGGTPRLGRQLPERVRAAGFEPIEVGARYEPHATLHRIADDLAATLERTGHAGSAAALRTWSETGWLFAQAWVWVVARRPASS